MKKTTESCVLYLRSSKDTHDISPAAQRTDLKAFAERKSFRIVAEFSDAAISANDNPPQLAALLQQLKDPHRGWTVILAMDSSRIARDMDLAGVISYQVRKAGARIEYSKMPSSDNPAMDMIKESIMRGFDAYHSMISKQKGLLGMKTNVQSGHRSGGRAPLGYALEHKETGVMRQGAPVRKSHLVPDPVFAPRVKQFLSLRVRDVARKEAARKSGLADKPDTTLISVERNALAYAGHTVWNRHAENGPHRYRPREEWIIQRDTHKALITDEEAEAIMARAMPTTRARRGPSGHFLLSGFLFTPSGQAMVSSGDNYYRAGKGRRINAEVLEAVVLDQCNEEADSHEFIDKFIAEAKRAADKLTVAPTALEAERKANAKKLATWVRLAEQAPDSTTVLGRLREVEAERDRIEAALRDAAKNAHVKNWLSHLTPEEAQKLLPELMERDGATVEERRAALRQLVERIEFDPATGTGRVHYRIGLNGCRFHLKTAAAELALGASGVLLASPRGFEPRLPP